MYLYMFRNVYTIISHIMIVISFHLKAWVKETMYLLVPSGRVGKGKKYLLVPSFQQ